MRARKKIAIYLPNLDGGGVAILYLKLASQFQDDGYEVVFLLNQFKGELAKQCPFRVIDLGIRRQLSSLPKLIAFLQKERPAILLSAIDQMNVASCIARYVSRCGSKHVLTQHNPLSTNARRRGWDYKSLPLLYRFILPLVDAVVAVSNGVAEDISEITGFSRNRIDVVYNGVVDKELDARVSKPLPSGWPKAGRPVFLNVARLAEQKDQGTLLRAFAIALEKTCADLVILGEGDCRAELTRLARELGIESHVHMLGYCDDPLSAMKAAEALVLSSTYEGLGIVLIEALACGTKVVSTDCPYGPSEILDNGRYGTLTPVGDASALANAMLASLSVDRNTSERKARGNFFSVQRCAEEHLKIFSRILQS